MPLTPGDKGPAFSLIDQAGEKVKLSGFKGRKVLVYSYPGRLDGREFVRAIRGRRLTMRRC